MTAGVVIDAVLVGRAVPFGRAGAASAIAKAPAAGAVALSRTGLAGDEQGDRRHHGGPDKAVHHYPGEHYEAWRRELRPAPAVLASEVLALEGAFGENLSTRGMTEDEVCVGDVYRAGTATLQVSQARQPCWKLNHRFGVADMARRVQSSGRTGWYYRVIEPGRLAAGDGMTLLDRPRPGWPLARVLRAFYVDMLDRHALAGIAALPELAPSWRDLARRRLESGRVENWGRRLGDRDPGAA
ncbi:MOSC domain-containing protein [Arenibaculum sp.]|uniref:MOSC domain-containing protein n=1 Tax=Arenibaculum sp. TaxID=2865862 RepID=UPI002E1670B8|nr:MOSC domain-containing protein [Arenibaculum sp.]